MKRSMMVILVIVMIVSLCACSGEGGKDTKKNDLSGGKTVSDVLADGEKTEDEEKPAGQKKDSDEGSDADVDIDLTELSSTMVYSEVSNMVTDPDNYIGRSVRMSGAFATAEGDGRMYYACIIKDATQCCSSGIEFIWEGDHSYPEDYPKEGDEITVVGDFDVYYEGEQRYIQLINAKLSF